MVGKDVFLRMKETGAGEFKFIIYRILHDLLFYELKMQSE